MNAVSTKYGNLIPCSGASDYRKKHRCAVCFFDSGALKSVYLEEPQVLSLPSGDFQAELITFYEDGNAKRIFPLYGSISAYWSVEEEAAAAPFYDFLISGETHRIRPECIFFYPSGKIRSITLWPSDELTVKTPLGPVKSKLGIELYESGRIRSIRNGHSYAFRRYKAICIQACPDACRECDTEVYGRGRILCTFEALPLRMP